MGFLKKLGIIEERYPQNVSDDMEDGSDLSGGMEVGVPDLIAENLIRDIYAKNEISELERSIYKVEKFMNTLPNEMPQLTKRATVLGILEASGIPIEDVLEDGEKRQNILISVKSEIDGSKHAQISEAENEIELLKAEIEKRNSDIYNAKAEMATADERIMGEVKTIEALVNFIRREEKYDH